MAPHASRLSSYAAFISYRHTKYSRAHAERLESALRQYAKPLWRPPIPIFRDERILRPGDDLPLTIRRALLDSDFLLYLATKDSAESRWVQDELRIWCEELNRTDRLLIVHVSDRLEADVKAGTVDWEQTDALPVLLKPFVPSIPVWVDLSWATTDEQRDLLNADYRKAINAITARLRGIEPGEMNDAEVLTHRRNLRLRNGFIGAIVASLLLAVYFGDQARRDRNSAVAAATLAEDQRQRAEKQRALAEQRARQIEMSEAYRLLDHGDENLRLGNVPQARVQFDESAGLFERLGLDPLMALHGRFAAAMRQLRIEPITSVNGEVSFLRVSSEGDLLAVGYDYQSPGGDPDLERIPDWPAAGVYSIGAKKWLLTHTVSSKIGAALYALGEGVMGFEGPESLIMDASEKRDGSTLVRLSMRDGTRRPCDERCRRAVRPRATLRGFTMSASLASLLQPERLFTVKPDDGIDEYSPRLVEETSVVSPEGRTALVGTYEGRLLLLDLKAGLARGEANIAPIFDIAYQHDGRAFVADRNGVFRVDTSSSPGVRELTVPLRPFRQPPYEHVLAVDLTDDGRPIIVTAERLLLLGSGWDKWSAWRFSKRLGAVAAFAIDAVRNRAIVVNGDDGRLIIVDLSSEAGLIEEPSLSGGKPAVAAIASDASMVWGTSAHPTSPLALVAATMITNRAATYSTLKVPLKPLETLGGGVPTVHAIGQVEDRLLLFYGDEQSGDENGVADEHMVSMRASDAAQPSDRVVFEAQNKMTGVGNYSSVKQVERVLPGSRLQRILVSVGGRLPILAIGQDGVTETSGTLMFRDIADHEQVYGLGVKHRDAAPIQIAIDHHGSGTHIAYDFPWSVADQSPILGAIDRRGRHVAILGNQGHIVLGDVNAIAQVSK